MKVSELLINIKNKNFNLERELQIKAYLPFQEKQNIAQLIIDECTQEVGGVIQVNSVQQYLSYVKYMINTHTCLEYTQEDYDTLCSTDYQGASLLTVIMSLFDADAKECTRILRLMINDYLQSNSLEMSVGKFLSNLSLNISELSGGLTDILEAFDAQTVFSEGINVDLLKKLVSAQK